MKIIAIALLILTSICLLREINILTVTLFIIGVTATYSTFKN